MKMIGDLVGVILALLGLFWILQGIGVVPVGFMAHQIQWAIIGLVLAIVGIGLVLFVNRRTGSTGATG